MIDTIQYTVTYPHVLINLSEIKPAKYAPSNATENCSELSNMA